MNLHADVESLAQSAPASASVSAREARIAWGLTFVVWTAAVAVFWAFDALPFQDLPAHAGLIALRHRFPSSPFEQQHFVLASHLGPYSLFRFLGEGFDRVVGAVGAVRALATLPVIATPAALWFARKRLHGDTSPTAIFFGVALSFGFMTILGFASYLLGLAVLLFVLTLWLELMAEADAGHRARGRETLVGALGIFLFVAHGHAFVLGLALMTFAALLPAFDRRVRAQARLGARVLRLRALAPSVLVAAYAAWLSRQGKVPAGSIAVPDAKLQPIFQTPIDKLGLLVTPTLTTRTGLDVVAGMVVWTVLLACAFFTARALWRSEASAVDARIQNHARALLWSAAIVALVFFALPHSIGWFGFVDGRLLPLVMFLLVMGFSRPLAPAVVASLDRAAPLAAGALVALALAASYRFQHEARGYHEVLARVPTQGRLLNLPVDPNSDIFSGHPFVHYDKLVLAERPIVVSDVWFHQGTALYPTPQNPALRLPPSYSESNLVKVEWAKYHLEDWDYVLVRTRPEGSPGPIPEALELDAHEGGWWLFRVKSPEVRPLAQ